MYSLKKNISYALKIASGIKIIKNSISNAPKVYPSQVTIVEVGPR